MAQVAVTKCSPQHGPSSASEKYKNRDLFHHWIDGQKHGPILPSGWHHVFAVLENISAHKDFSKDNLNPAEQLEDQTASNSHVECFWFLSFFVLYPSLFYASHHLGVDIYSLATRIFIREGTGGHFSEMKIF